MLLFTRECGHIGVTTKHELSGLRTGPPAAIEYAVEPVGVETIIPSALLEVTSLPSQETFMSIKRAKSPLETTASFRQWYVPTISLWLSTSALIIIRLSTSYLPLTRFLSKSSSSLSSPLIKPTRPAFIPNVALLSNEASFAIFKVVPSPPMDIAISHFEIFSFTSKKPLSAY